MKSILFSVVGVLCLIGLSQGVPVKGDCTSDTCDANLVCVSNVCKAKVHTACTASSTDECVALAECPASAMCTCPDTHVPNADNTTCLTKINETCVATADCVTSATCEDKNGAMTCQCATTQAANAHMTMCKTKIDETCTDTVDCVMGSTCVDNGGKKCECAATEVKNTDKTMCHIKLTETCNNSSGNDCVMGASCMNSKCMCMDRMTNKTGKVDRCYGLSGGQCSDLADCFDSSVRSECKDMKCACKANSMVDDADHMCKLKAGQNCGGNAECGPNAMCDTTCKCNANFVDEGGRCGLPVGGNCTGNAYAYCVNNAECKDMKCVCKTDYMTDGNMCKKTSGSSMLAGSLVLVLAAFISTRYH